ncbi:similar to Saccharomyces cerevisiae YGL238W CSE1 Nuclear envelope protein that mediates the nuclear export of importin alpha (Srp1p) [Maudiozyma saulgeensis]|uniref:Similar to Saccharomyces cerevisiae YGL238W CSE1 Nuclear envelope protein that mediates the nuclear export of importin alpha (Srp1p) n=1 Tax=Maudiozyma saulgeensis TaxID=1789683 RepID=A0A1X7QX67_9SACH|nr:similar to Saccharomyces cerevisiae YGL238W CSE1 Nuclear envelope protein that mediates the nuclear export of importin alpha (Srp1p) [Kazachstania saulgeensis]
MSDIEIVSKLLSDSVIAQTSKLAEKSLKELESQDGFGLTLLHVVAAENLSISTRLAGALFFKNFLKRKWVDENGNHLLSVSSVELIKKEIIPLMISLPANLQIQIGEAISIIADSDFPTRWPGFLDDLVSRLSPDNMILNKGVLIVAHSIFKRWRPLFRSDDLFLEIKLVLDKFTIPFLSLLETVDKQIDENKNNTPHLTLLFDVLLVLIKLYYDFNCQDIPEFFEDNIQQGMGILHKYLSYSNTLLEDPDDPENTSIVTKVKSAIQEVVQLYTTRYDDVFSPMVNGFIEITWSLLTSTSDEPKYDILVSKSLAFLTAVSRNPKYFEMFNNQEAMNNLTEQVILPNVTLRESDVELFEDDPIEYIRRDLEGSDTDTRRRACTDFLNELKEKNETLVTNTFMIHMKKFFEQYQSNPTEYWKYKDLYVFLFTTLAITGNITSAGVSTTNPQLNVVEFFTVQIIPDLTGNVANNILKVDAIKFIYMFRNQLSKNQLIEILPLLANFLTSDEYVVYTYAAVTIERILSIRESVSSPNFIFSKNDISSSAEMLLGNLINLIMKQGTVPEKLAENEFLMKAIFRVLQTAEDTIQGSFPTLLNQLISIINIIVKNPSNPRFSHYTFESVGCLLRYTPTQSLITLIDSMMPCFLHILSEDIQEFVAYVFQLISFGVEKAGYVPDTVKQLAQPLLSPSVWDLKGNVPAVTRLLKDLIKFDKSIFQDLIPVLGVFQRLIASKAYEVHGFELLEAIVLYINLDQLKPYLKQIAVLLLQRLQTSKTERYVKKLVVFLGLISWKMNGDFVVQFIDEVQDGIFSQIWNSFIIPTLPTLGNLLDRKISLLGVTKIVTESSLFANKYPQLVAPTFETLIKTLVSEDVANFKSDFVDLDNMEEIVTFGSSFSKLGVVSEKAVDPLPEVDLTNGLKLYISQLLSKYVTNQGANFSNSILPNLTNETQTKLNQLLTGA